MLLLTALGVDWPVIVENYLITNERMAASADCLLTAVADYDLSESEREVIRTFDRADAAFLTAARDAIAERRHDSQVMGNHDDRGPVFPGQPPDQFQDLCLYGDIQRRGGLIGDQKLRLRSQGRSDDHALPLSAGKLKGILLHAPLGLGNADLAQHLNRALPRFLPAACSVGREALRQLCSDGQHRVQIGHRVLKDHADAVAPDGAEHGLVPPQRALPGKSGG